MSFLKSLKIMNGLKTWGTLIVAVFALAVSINTCRVENVRYQEITKPHTQHDEIYDKLVRLDTKMERAKELIHFWASHGDNITDLQNILRNAEITRNEAEKAWFTNDYGEADNLINEAYDSLDEIPLPPPGTSWDLIIVIVIVAIVAIISWAVMRRRRA